MNKWALASVGAALGVAAYVAWRRPEGVARDVEQVGGFLKLSSAFNGVRVASMRDVTPAIINNRNVQAMLRVIRQGESSLLPVAYQMVCGKRGAQFTSFADHPRPKLAAPCTRGAAGAYQITTRTWDWVRAEMRLADFSPANQDAAAVGLMAYRGALPAVVGGDLKTALGKLRNEWTSLPGANENTFTTMESARLIFAQYGGMTTA